MATRDDAADGNPDTERNGESSQKAQDSNASEIDHLVQGVPEAADENANYEWCRENSDPRTASEQRGSSGSCRAGHMEIFRFVAMSVLV